MPAKSSLPLKSIRDAFFMLLALLVWQTKANAITQTFYTGSQKTFVVPAGITLLTFDMAGGQGGDGQAAGGLGGRTVATYPVTPGTTIYINAGGFGGTATTFEGGGKGGFNGGAKGGDTRYTSGGGGGGASDIRIGGTGVGNRVLVAGGGGGGGSSNGGSGGGSTGGNGFGDNFGSGATQAAGGTGGSGNDSGSLGSGGRAYTTGGGGGGGYYGGGGGGSGGGGGGSGFVGAAATAATMTTGVQSGDGYVTITSFEPAVTAINPASGSTVGGTVVTITGTGFTGATGVTIGGTVAGFSVVNSTRIAATTPLHLAGSASVLVTTPAGVNVANTLYTYVPPRPTVTAISPSRGSMLGGTSVMITGAAFIGASAVTIGGTAATGVSVVNDTTITAITPLHVPGTASVLVTTPGGTSTANTLYTYEPPPAVTLTTTPLNPSATTLTITGTGFNATTPGNNTVVFSPAGTGTVNAATATSLNVTGVSGLRGGPLSAVVTNINGGSGTALQVAAVVPVVASSTANLTTNATPSTILTITGVGFDPTAANNTVAFTPAGTGTVTGATATTLTVQSLTNLTKGALSAIVTTNGQASASAQVATVVGVPTVTALSAGSGIPGTPLIITGTNFNATAANNIVYFGSVRANVTLASTTSLTVTIPTGSVFAPAITVQDSTTGLLGASNTPFLATYDNSPFAPGTVNFDPKTNLAVLVSPSKLAYGDLDGDGRTDVIVNNSGTGNVTVYRNTSTAGSVSFASPGVVVATGLTFPGQVSVGDMDGDGKPDLVVMSASGSPSGSMRVYLNTSTLGSISFSPVPLAVNYVSNANCTALADMDGDGRLDVVGSALSTLSVFRNTSTPGGLSFATRVNFTAPATINFIATGDMDGDAKPDILVSTSGTPALSIFRNTSTLGNVGLATRQDFNTLAGAGNYVALADIDGDGKQDVLTINQGAGSFSVFPGLSVPGSIGLGTRADLTVGGNAGSLFVADFDGDGRPDVAATSTSSSTVSVFRNTSSSGSFSFTSAFFSLSGAGAAGLAAFDIDGDGRTDMAVLNQSTTTLSFFRNDPLQSMAANAGTTPQSTAVGTAFANALAVTVTTASGLPAVNVNVTFTAPASGASGTFSNSTNTITVATNALGVASAPFTANAMAGVAYAVTATLTGPPTVTFSLINVGPPSSIVVNSGSGQSATVGTAFAAPLSVSVLDAFTNAIPNVSVTFTAPATGASGWFSNSTATIIVTANAAGEASVPFTANTVATAYSVSASATGVATTIPLMNLPGAPSSMTANPGTTPQSTAPGSAFANALAVTVADAFGNPVSDVTVTFTAPGTGPSGQFTKNIGTFFVFTNASGVASAPFTANATAGGPYTVMAAAPGLTSVNFSLTNASITVVVTSSVDATPGTPGTTFESVRSGMAISGTGALAFRGYLSGTSVTVDDFQSIWKSPDGTVAATTLVARTGITVEPSVGALFDILPVNPIINNAAQTSFIGMLRVNSGSPAVTTSTDTGVWSELGTGGLKKLLREGDTLSGSTVGTVAPSTWITGNASAAAFTVKLGTGSALVRVDVAGTTVTPFIIAKQGDTAPVKAGGDAGTFDALGGNTSDPRMDATGAVAFLSTVVPTGSGIWYKTASGALTAVANTNQPAPGQGGPVFTGFERPSLSSDGSTIAFRAFLSGANGHSVFKGSPAALVAIARTNDTAISGVPAGRKLWSVWSPFTNNTGRVAFRVSLVDTATSANESRAIATDTNGTLTVIAKVGDTAPGLGVETFTNFDHPIIGDGDQCAFIASTSGGSVGLFRQAAGGGALTLVVAVGDVVNFTGGGSDSIAQMIVPGTATDDRKYETKSIDASGRILVHATYFSGKTGILLTAP